jgi:uncharacterized protein (TIGR02996 family)
MISEDAFLFSILERPDDNGPRLVYADWLEEEGDADRAELIRLQCGSGDAARERELISRNGSRWAGPMLRSVYSYAFRRGFVEEVTVEAGMFLELGERLFAAAPVRLVRLIQARAVLGRLFKSPLLSRLSALHLTECKIANEGAILLADCPHVTGLQTLRLGENAMDDQAIEVLSDSPNLTNLTSLSMPGNLIGDLGARLLASSTRFPHLESLDLSRNQIGDVGAEALALSPHLRLTQLNLASQFNDWPPGLPFRSRPHPIQPKQQKALLERYGAACNL